MPITAPIPMPQNGMDAFMAGMQNSQSMFNALVANRNTAAQAAAQEAKNPYVGQQSQADLLKTQLENKWYGPKTQSEINLQGSTAGYQNAEAQLERLKNNNPGLLGDDNAKNSAILNILYQRHPELVQQAHQDIAASASPSGSNIQTSAQPNLLQQAQAAMQPAGMTPMAQPGNMTTMPQQAQSAMPPTQPNAAPVAQNPQNQMNASPAAQQADFLTRGLNANIEKEEAQAKYYGNAMGLGRGMGGVKIQQQRALQMDLQRDNPGFNDDQTFEAAGNILDGKNELSDGTPINVSGLTRQNVVNFQGTAAPTALKTQAANYDVLADDMKNIDLDALKSFTGVAGKVKLAEAKTKMAAGDPNIDPMARRYLSAVNQAILTMDGMRKAFGTSVVPDYVYKTIGQLANPNSSIWNDPKQVEQTYKDTLNTISKNRDEYMKKVREGVTANSNNEENSSKNPEEQKSGSEENTSQVIKYKRVNGKLMTV